MAPNIPQSIGPTIGAQVGSLGDGALYEAPCKGAHAMLKGSVKRIVATVVFIVIFGSMLGLLAACGGTTKPASPGGNPNPPGYSLIGVFHHEIQVGR